jgi:hypothetical protein
MVCPGLKQHEKVGQIKFGLRKCIVHYFSFCFFRDIIVKAGDMFDSTYFILHEQCELREKKKKRRRSCQFVTIYLPRRG